MKKLLTFSAVLIILVLMIWPIITNRSHSSNPNVGRYQLLEATIKVVWGERSSSGDVTSRIDESLTLLRIDTSTGEVFQYDPKAFLVTAD